MFRKARIFVAASLLAVMSSGAVAKEPVRIDGSTDAAAEASFKRMLKQAPTRKKQELHMAMLAVVMDDVGSAYELVQRPELKNPSIALVKERVDGMTADELIALAKTSSVQLEAVPTP